MKKINYEVLKQTREALLNEIKQLDFDIFNNKLDKQTWSIAQVCHHLVLVELATIKALKWGLSNNHLNSDERKDIHIILDRTKKIKAPKIVEPDISKFKVEEIEILLTESRQKLFSHLQTIDNKSLLAKKAVDHPAFGSLPFDQWIDMIHFHERRHIEQIKEILNKLNG